MQRFRKHIILFLTLALASNVVFAAKMSVSMASNGLSTELAASPSCHGDNSSSTAIENTTIDQTQSSSEKTDNLSCCNGDCGSCVPATMLPPTQASVGVFTPNSQTRRLHDLLALAHNIGPFRPPIAI